MADSSDTHVGSWTRGTAWECDECGSLVHPEETHHPHSKECAQLDGAESCQCSTVVCPSCCWHPECRVEVTT